MQTHTVIAASRRAAELKGQLLIDAHKVKEPSVTAMAHPPRFIAYSTDGAERWEVLVELF